MFVLGKPRSLGLEIYHGLKLGAERLHIARADRTWPSILPLLTMRDLAEKTTR